ncbi:hypothetical protein A0J61_10369 [Choanephora cucurbitarum]|uniref:Uncharacterized protein n=1 Tax=Choanephora cucurbitarum TaxID=101091 RepID=A0A1C7MXM6_9FUNG|nr:hypothetical protein A0J61_10369 [Choanephora cucurbitarum]
MALDMSVDSNRGLFTDKDSACDNGRAIHQRIEFSLQRSGESLEVETINHVKATSHSDPVTTSLLQASTGHNSQREGTVVDVSLFQPMTFEKTVLHDTLIYSVLRWRAFDPVISTS